MTQLSKVDIAKQLATALHTNQVYGAGNCEYGVHLQAVENVLRDFGYVDEFWVICAWLHDTLEDTNISRDLLESIFWWDIADTVFAVSGFGYNRKERMADICSKISACRDAVIVKMADRIANVEACVNSGSKYGPMYLTEKKKFQEATFFHAPECMTARLNRAYDRIQNRAYEDQK